MTCRQDGRAREAARAPPPPSGSGSPEAPNAVSFRDARYILRVLSSPEGPGLRAVRAAHARLDEAVAPWTLGRSLNFVYGERRPTDLLTSRHTPETLRRLSALRPAYDPSGIFRGTRQPLAATPRPRSATLSGTTPPP